MIRKIAINSVLILAIAMAVFLVHSKLLKQYNVNLNYAIKPIYLFHTIASLIIYIVLDVMSQLKKFSSQIGFLYLGTFIFKIAVFAMVFYNSILSLKLTKTESLNLLIPVFLFLLVEVIFLAKILNRK